MRSRFLVLVMLVVAWIVRADVARATREPGALWLAPSSAAVFFGGRPEGARARAGTPASPRACEVCKDHPSAEPRTGEDVPSTGVEGAPADNALGALKTNAGIVLDDQRNKLAGGGTADAAVPNTYNSQPVTLDLGGRVTSLFGNTLVYNRRGRLVSVKLPAPVNNKDQEYYAYDAQLRRIGRFGVNGGQPITTDIEYFDWDGPNLIASQDAQNVHTSWLYEGVDQPLRVAYSAARYYYEVDLAGNVRRLRGADGSDQGGYRYTAFGAEYPHDCSLPATPGCQAPTPSVTQPLRWKARWWSDFSQLYDVRARWWSPQLGVFTSVDEFKYYDDLSTLWGWPRQNPIMYWDLNGHAWSLNPNNWDDSSNRTLVIG